jgi:uncharacterized zinc-type alcohol dehydrogenase-like protein
MSVKAYGAYAADKPLEPMDIERREPGDHDVQIEIAYCGVCHSDLHTVRSEWGGPSIPVCLAMNRRSHHGGGRRCHRLQRRRQPWAWVASSAVASIVTPATKVWSSTARTAFVGTYNGPTAEPPGHTLGGLLQEDRRQRQVCTEDPSSRNAAGCRCATCCARASPPTHRCATGTWAGEESRHRGHRWTWHMGIKLAHAMGAYSRGVHDQRGQAPGRAGPRRGRSGGVERSG